jgi:methylated-DNA-[protein]-cysteine S-methyltransferase
MGLVGAGETLSRLYLGHTTADQVRLSANAQVESEQPQVLLPEADWHPKLRRALQDFARGLPVNFADVKIDLGSTTPFRAKVLQLTRKIAFGQTASYGELAARAGNPKAARAIGAVMATNRIPIIIPCHRVVASGGAIGGFTARDGINLKRRLLEMEGASVR